MPVLKASGLAKDYGNVEAVRDIDFEVARKECLGILGPNGAGKSTTIHMLYGLVRPSTGDIAIFGQRFDAGTHRKTKHKIGVMPQELNLDTELSVYENLVVYARYFSLKKTEYGPLIDGLLEFFELDEKKTYPIDSLSGGMKRRLMLARALINNPDLLILDEPTTGLDPQARHAIWDRLVDLKHQGITQILTTHYMDEAEYLCDRVIIMDHGRILAQGVPTELIAGTIGTELIEVLADKPIPAGTFQESKDVEVYYKTAFFYNTDVDSVVHMLKETQIEPDDLRRRKATLEDYFLYLTGRSLRD